MESNNGSSPEQSIFVVLPKTIIDKFLKHERAADLIALYGFYSYTATWQGTNQPKATIAYVANGLRWGHDKVRRIKKILVGMKVIEDVTQRNPQSGQAEGWFIRIKHFPKLKSHPRCLPECGLNHRVASKTTNACSSGSPNAFSAGNRNAYSSLSKENQTASTIPSNHREIIDRFNEKCAGIVKGGRRVTKCTERLANAIRVALNDAGGVKPLFDLFDAIADDRVSPPLRNKFTLTGVLWDYTKGRIKITPKRCMSVQDQQRLRRANKEQAECA